MTSCSEECDGETTADADTDDKMMTINYETADDYEEADKQPREAVMMDTSAKKQQPVTGTLSRMSK